MYSRSQTPRRHGQSSGIPSTPSLRPSSALSARGQTPASLSRLQSSRLHDRPFSPVKERPTSSLSFSSRPTTPSFAQPSQPYSGTITVAIRAKPSNTFLKDPWLLTNDSIQHNDIGEFKFNHVFHPNASNREVYEKCVKNLIESLMDGYNATVFAYGMTGSGKTYSMSGDKHEPGVIPLSIREIFNKIESSDKSIYKYDLKVSYLEIYNEKIHDLLNVSQPQSLQADLKIRDVPNYGVKVIGLVEENIKSEEELFTIIQKGDLNRRTGETDFNARSSRSHAIVLVRVTIANTVTGIETFSTLSLCDLAGSERATTQQDRRKEGSYINKSLLALGSVIVKLSSASTSIGHIPYRDSKLTRLLQPALSGDSVVAILCTIHTSNSALAETVNTVRFAARAKNISLNVKKNENEMTSDKDRMIEKLKFQIESQRMEIESLKKRSSSSRSITIGDPTNLNVDEDTKEQIVQLTSENRILVEQLEHLKRLTDERNAEKMILKNEIINDILTGTESNNTQPPEQLIRKIEELFKRSYAEIDEYKSYINHLEYQLKQEVQNNHSDKKPKIIRDQSFSPSKVANESEVDSILRDQEDEILELKNELKNKEKIIKALQSAKRVRESLINTIHLSDSRRESGRYDTLKPLNGDKINQIDNKLGL